MVILKVEINFIDSKIMPMMKKKSSSITIAIIMLAFGWLALYAGAVIVDFRGEPGHGKVTLYWSTLNETNCKGFQIDRSLNKVDFKKIAFVKSQGNSTERKDYSYEDKTVFKSEMDRTFYYRLTIINEDNTESVYSQIVSVTPSISGARYTWGSIKALFR